VDESEARAAFEMVKNIRNVVRELLAPVPATKEQE
jgi:hypothetical protein